MHIFNVILFRIAFANVSILVVQGLVPSDFHVFDGLTRPISILEPGQTLCPCRTLSAGSLDECINKCINAEDCDGIIFSSHVGSCELFEEDVLELLEFGDYEIIPNPIGGTLATNPRHHELISEVLSSIDFGSDTASADECKQVNFF